MSDPLFAITASGMTTALLLKQLVGTLQRKGIISADDAREMYEAALLDVEQLRGAASPLAQEVHDLVRKQMEDQLRKNPRT
jgi:hypothetical protein